MNHESQNVLPATARPLSGRFGMGVRCAYVFKHSDATFNIGFALAAAQIKSTGVYIAMNGKLFDYDKVVKNKELAEFQSI